MKDKIIQNFVAKAKTGDKKAMEVIYKTYYSQIFYYVYSRVNNLHIAQDIVSDTFLSIVESIRKYKGQSSFKNYLFGITKNKLRDYIKSKYKSENYVLESTLTENVFDIIPDTPQAEKDLTKSYRNRLRKIFEVILKKMKPRYAKLLQLKYMKMYSLEEIAKYMGITVNNVKVIQHRAIKQARMIWERMEPAKRQKYLIM